MANEYTICRGSLPTWHDQYIEGSQELIALTSVTMPSRTSANSTKDYFAGGTSILCLDETDSPNVVGKNARFNDIHSQHYSKFGGADSKTRSCL